MFVSLLTLLRLVMTLKTRVPSRRVNSVWVWKGNFLGSFLFKYRARTLYSKVRTDLSWTLPSSFCESKMHESRKHQQIISTHTTRRLSPFLLSNRESSRDGWSRSDSRVFFATTCCWDNFLISLWSSRGWRVVTWSHSQFCKQFNSWADKTLLPGPESSSHTLPNNAIQH